MSVGREADGLKLDEVTPEQVPVKKKKRNRRRPKKSEAKFASSHVLKANQTLTGYTPLASKSINKRTSPSSSPSQSSDSNDETESLIEPIKKMRMDSEKEMASLESRQRVLIHHIGKQYGKDIDDANVQLTGKEKKMLRALTFSHAKRAEGKQETGDEIEEDKMNE